MANYIPEEKDNDSDEQKIEKPIVGPDEYEMRNWMDDQKVLDYVNEEVTPRVKQVRENRQAKLDQDWIRYRDIYNLRRTTAYYEGRSKLFLGVLRKAVDTLVRMGKQTILSEPYFAVETDIPKWKDLGTQYMKHLLEDEGRLREIVPIFLRQLYQIGTSCLKYCWRKSCRTVKYREKDEDGVSQIKEVEIFDHYGPSLEVVDMRRVFVWPESAINYDQLKLVFEDTVYTVRELKKLAERGFFNQKSVDDIIEAKHRSLMELRKADSQVTKEGIEEILPRENVDMTLTWAQMALPDKDGDEHMQWVLIYHSGSIVCRINENPWWFGTPNYKFGALYREHDYFYGHGLIEADEMWQYMLNDSANQTMDTSTFTLNPIVKYDPALIDDPDVLQLEPMAKWPVGKDGAVFERPPADLALQGINMLRFLINIVQDDTGATAMIQGSPNAGGRASGTATGASQLFAAGNAMVLDHIEDLQEQVFTPMIKDIEIMAHEMMDEPMVIRYMGPEGITLTQRIISPEDLVLSNDIRWISGTRAKQNLAKGQQTLNWFNITMGIPDQATVAQGFRINRKEAIMRVADALGMENPDRLVEDITQSVPGIPPEIETSLILAGRKVVASPLDPPELQWLHIQAHQHFRAPNQLAQIRMQEHIASHFANLQAFQAQMQAQMAKGGGPSGGPAPQPQAAMHPPLPAQEQPKGASEGEQGAGLLSQVGGATGQ